MAIDKVIVNELSVEIGKSDKLTRKLACHLAGITDGQAFTESSLDGLAKKYQAVRVESGNWPSKAVVGTAKQESPAGKTALKVWARKMLFVSPDSIQYQNFLDSAICFERLSSLVTEEKQRIKSLIEVPEPTAEELAELERVAAEQLKIESVKASMKEKASELAIIVENAIIDERISKIALKQLLSTVKEFLSAIQ